MPSRTVLLTVAAFGSGLALPLGTAQAAEPISISGRNSCKTVEQHAIPVAGDPEHVVVLLKQNCATSASGQSARFDGGQLTGVYTADLVNGNGMLHGYYVGKYKDGSTAVFGVAGLATTAMANGKPTTTFQGTWEMTHGTGSLANAQTRGTFRSEPTSDTDTVSPWEGTLTEGASSM